MQTRILSVSSSDVKFTSSDLTSHAYERPQIHLSHSAASVIQEAADLLKNNDPVSFPTETVYGLGANALNSEAVSKIYAAKNRPADNPLILHIASLHSLRTLLGPSKTIPRIYEPLIARFWPGPLTILLPLDRQHTKISELCTGNQDTFAVRMPQHPVALALLHVSDLPLAAPSANTSTRPSPTTAQHVYNDLTGRIPFIVDGGPCEVGLESTVVDGLTSPPQILRPGGVSLEQVREIPGWEQTIVHRPGIKDEKEVPKTPGMKYRHYSPTARVLLFEHTASCPSEESLVDYGIADNKLAVCRTRTWPASLASQLGNSVTDTDLGTNGRDIARRLFGALRDLDAMGIEVILVEGIADTDEGLAVMNRLRKAAASVIS